MLISLGLLMILKQTESGFNQPVTPEQLLKTLYGNPCDCSGGIWEAPPSRYSSSADFGDKNAHLGILDSTTGGVTQKWVCIRKPKPLPAPGRKCAEECNFVDQMNAICYTEYTVCSKDGKTYFMAIPHRTFGVTFGGDWSVIPQTDGPNQKYAQASCTAPPGKPTCWPQTAPIHVSDGGPTDQVKDLEVPECPH